MSHCTNQKSGTTCHRFFAAIYERTSSGASERKFMEPLRRELLAQAYGIVLEIGAGTGLNFPFYDSKRVERVEAVEPDTAMLNYARKRQDAAPVPITLTQAPVESLPFADATFDCVIATLVFCSVTDPARGLNEIRRVLKPDGTLLMIEHVRATNSLLAGIQDFLVPITTRTMGNCHWNRNTTHTISDAGFTIKNTRDLGGLLVPMLLLEAQHATQSHP